MSFLEFHICAALIIAVVLYIIYSIVDSAAMIFLYLFPPQTQPEVIEIISRWA